MRGSRARKFAKENFSILRGKRLYVAQIEPYVSIYKPLDEYAQRRKMIHEMGTLPVDAGVKPPEWLSKLDDLL